MPWTETTAATMTDGRCDTQAIARVSEWMLIEPFLAAKTKVGRSAPDRHARRLGCDPEHCPDRLPWALLPKDFPPFTTVQYHFAGCSM